MRQIKFRCWSQRLKQMRYDWTGFSILAMSESKYNPVIPMEFTGFKDKNGREIYEGDVIRTRSYSKRWDDGAIGDVSFGDGAFRFNWKILLAKSGEINHREPISTICSSIGYDTDKRDGDIEVIGNIYDNPDLLTFVNKSDIINVNSDSSLRSLPSSQSLKVLDEPKAN